MNCPNCGISLPERARFCTGCGAKLGASTQKPQFCTVCGAERRPGAAFCPSCGTPYQREIPAPAQSGEFVCAERSLETAAPAAAPSYLQRLLQILKQPRTLIPLAALLAAWIGLSFAMDSDSTAVKLLSWLSFGRGGLNRGFPGDLGGLLGKATVGTALLSLCSGSLRSLGSGAGAMLRQFKAVFSGKSGAAGIAGAVLGLLAGAGLYLLFAGIGAASWESTMAGIAGALLSLLGLGGAFSGGGKQDAKGENKGGFLPALLAGAVPGFILCAAVLAIV